MANASMNNISEWCLATLSTCKHIPMPKRPGKTPATRKLRGGCRNLDPLRLGALCLGKRDGENAVFEVGTNLIRLDTGGKGECPTERPKRPFHPMVVLLLDRLFGLALAPNRQDVIFE